jgi:hypothetical protein
MTTMKTETDAFIDTPPEGFLPLSQKALTLIIHVVKRAGLELDTVEMVGAYRAISNGNGFPTANEINNAFIEMTDAEFDAVTAYVTRVMARREEAEVVIESTPGK